GDEEEGREDREVEAVLEQDRSEEDQDGERQVGGQEQVEHDRRDRHHHHQDGGDQERRDRRPGQPHAAHPLRRKAVANTTATASYKLDGMNWPTLQER